jgi:hypothetical protein
VYVVTENIMKTKNHVGDGSPEGGTFCVDSSDRKYERVTIHHVRQFSKLKKAEGHPSKGCCFVGNPPMPRLEGLYLEERSEE